MKLLRYTLIIAAASAAAIYFINPSWSPFSEQAIVEKIQSEAAQASAKTSQQDFSVSADGSIDEAAWSLEERRQITIESMHELLMAAQQQPGNLLKTLKDMEKRCAISEEDCQQLIEDALASYQDAEFASLILNAISRLPLYEATMQETVMSMETPPRERYETIHTLRQEILGNDETEALFGQEAAWAEYQFSYGELLSADNLTNLSTEERLNQLAQIREQSLGQYSEALEAVEGEYGRYERELAVVTEGLEDIAEIEALTEQLRITHFGEETAAQMAARDDVVREQQQILQAYNDAVTQLDASMEPLKQQMDEASWQQLYDQQITDIRLQYFPEPSP